MQLLWFLLGLAIGLFPLSVYRAKLNSRIKSLTKEIPIEEVGLSVTTQLAIAISHQQEQVTALERAIKSWKQIINTSPIGYLQVDEDNQLISCNPAACKMLEINQCSFDPPRLLLEIVRSYEIDSLIEKARDRNQPCKKDWVFHPASADAEDLSQRRSLPLRGLAFPLMDDQIGVFLENRQEAVTLAQQRDRWTSDVAHELKTPLTSIRLVAETLQSRVDPNLKQWVDRLLNETIRLSNLVQDLLDLSRLDLNPTQRLKQKSSDLVKIIYAAWQSLEPLSSERQVRLSYIGEESIIVKADEARMHRVFLNLFDNAIKYSPENSAIAVQITQHDTKPRFQIDIIDSGSGFPEEALPHVFERFYRADPSRVRSAPRSSAGSQELQITGGSGLGLAIVRQIIEAHQGSVRAQNHPKTGGAWLQILLP